MRWTDESGWQRMFADFPRPGWLALLGETFIQQWTAMDWFDDFAPIGTVWGEYDLNKLLWILHIDFKANVKYTKYNFCSTFYISLETYIVIKDYVA